MQLRDSHVYGYAIVSLLILLLSVFNIYSEAKATRAALEVLRGEQGKRIEELEDEVRELRNLHGQRHNDLMAWVVTTRDLIKDAGCPAAPLPESVIEEGESDGPRR